MSAPAVKKLNLLDLVIRYDVALAFLAGAVITAVAFTVSISVAIMLAFLFIGIALFVANEQDRRQHRALCEAPVGRHHHAPTA